MAKRFRRRRNGERAALASDVAAIGAVLDAGPAGDEPELAELTKELFERAPTADLERLRERGFDAASFYADELRPNWEGRSQAERAAQVAAFMRFANVLGSDDGAGMGPLVRTKVIVLAWACDRVYGEDLRGQIASKPQRFGSLELSASE